MVFTKVLRLLVFFLDIILVISTEVEKSSLFGNFIFAKIIIFLIRHFD